MPKLMSLSAATVLFASTTAFAATTLTSGIYSSTLEFVSVTNDSMGACAAQGVKTGVVESGIAENVGLGLAPLVSTPVPSSGGLGDQVCQLNKLPSRLVVGQATPYSGTVNCSLGGTTYQIVTAKGNGTATLIDANSYIVAATATIELNGSPLCDVQTSTLSLRTGS